MREHLELGVKTAGTYLPRRREGDHLQVITVINFKGGSGKITTAAHLAQKWRWTGTAFWQLVSTRRQASLSALHGFQPEFDLLDGETLYDAIRSPCPKLSRKPIFRTLISSRAIWI